MVFQKTIKNTIDATNLMKKCESLGIERELLMIIKRRKTAYLKDIYRNEKYNIPKLVTKRNIDEANIHS